MLGKTSLSLTVLGFGGSRIGNLHGPVAPDEARGAIEEALARGVGYFDTAPLYAAGLGEHRMGEVLRDVARDRFVLSTKFGRLCRPVPPRDAPGPYTHHLPFELVNDYSADAVMRSLEASLLRLGQSRIDIALIHDIDFRTYGEDQPRRFREAMDGAYVALDRLRAEGVISAVGVGVNSIEVCRMSAEAGDFDCFLLAREFSLLDHPRLASFLALCRERQIGLIVGAPFNSGILARGSRSSATYHDLPPTDDALGRVATLEAICQRHGVSLMAAALQFPLRHPNVTSIVPGMRSAAQSAGCAEAIVAPIPPAFWAEVDACGLLPPDLVEELQHAA